MTKHGLIDVVKTTKRIVNKRIKSNENLQEFYGVAMMKTRKTTRHYDCRRLAHLYDTVTYGFTASILFGLPQKIPLDVLKKQLGSVKIQS